MKSRKQPVEVNICQPLYAAFILSGCIGAHNEIRIHCLQSQLVQLNISLSYMIFAYHNLMNQLLSLTFFFLALKYNCKHIKASEKVGPNTNFIFFEPYVFTRVIALLCFCIQRHFPSVFLCSCVFCPFCLSEHAHACMPVSGFLSLTC